MKKLLTILVLALALCLVCGAAMADEHVGLYNLDDLPTITSVTLKGETVTLRTGTITFNPSSTELQAAFKAGTYLCTDYVPVKVNAVNDADGTAVPEFEIRVRYAADHVWKDVEDEQNVKSDCSTAGKQMRQCTICGTKKLFDLSKLAHSYVDEHTANCKTSDTNKAPIYQKCSKCGEYLMKDGKKAVVGEDNLPGPHAWTIQVTYYACTYDQQTPVNGKATFKCSVCEKSASQAQWGTEKINGKTLTAYAADMFGTAAGLTEDAGVGKLPVDEAMSKKAKNDANYDGHTYGEWGPEEPATCGHAAQRQHRCKVCGYTVAKAVEGSKPLDPEFILDPAVTCKTPAASACFYCKNCGKNSTIAGHQKITGLTRTDNGVDGVEFKKGDLKRTVYHNLTVTKTEYKDAAEANTWTAYNKITDTTWCTTGKTVVSYKCSVCNATPSKTTTNTAAKPGHQWGEWIKTDDDLDVKKWTRVCPICKKIQTTTINPGEPACEEHTWVPDEGQTIKCGKNANIKQTCSVCGAQQTAEYERKDSWKQIGVVKAPTCTEKGVGLAICTYEGCENIDYPEIEATGHKPVEVAEVPATCKTTGTKAGYKCENCGKFLDENKADANVIEALEVIPVDETAHVKGELEAEVPATCTAEGKKLYTCTVCGKTITEKIEKLAHTWDAGVITKEATMEAKGEKTFTCTVCGETKKEEVEWVPAEPAKYTMTASYDGKTVTGKLVHDDTTVEAPDKTIRVTFYLEGDIYMATMAEVAADGTFSVDGVGPIKYITVAATGNSSVNPEKYEKIAEAQEIFVK